MTDQLSRTAQAAHTSQVFDDTLAALGAAPSAPWPEDAVYDRLIGDWHFWQRRRGHRTSTDDLLAAWFAIRRHGDAGCERYLDIGCGVGSVLLQTAYILRPDQSFGVEAQAQSAMMAERSVRELPGSHNIIIREGDLRSIDSDRAGKFNLITGSPPYIPPGAGTPSADPQRHACRFELRGGVEEYSQAASRLLAPRGRFVLVFQSIWEPRVIAAGEDAGLKLEALCRAKMRSDNDDDFLGVYSWMLPEDAPERPHRESITIRDERGEWTQEFRELRAMMKLAQ